MESALDGVASHHAERCQNRLAPLRGAAFPWFVARRRNCCWHTLRDFCFTALHRQAPSIRAVINPPPDTHFRLTSDLAGPPVLSPDGGYVAFTAIGADGKTSLWVRSMNGADARSLPDTSDAIFPFWSPDSRSLGFFAYGNLRTIELTGSTAQTLCDAQLGRGGAWAPDGTIVFSPSPISGLLQISASGGSGKADPQTGYFVALLTPLAVFSS